MTAHALLQVARRHNAPDRVLRYLEDRAVAETLEALSPTRTSAPVWPWVLLAIVACLLTAAAVVPHAEPIAQIADGSEE